MAEKQEVLKDIHFQVPEELWESFYRAFPERGERKIILTKFVKEAVRMQGMKDYFVTLVSKQVTIQEVFGEKEES